MCNFSKLQLLDAPEASEILFISNVRLETVKRIIELDDTTRRASQFLHRIASIQDARLLSPIELLLSF